MLKLSCLMAVAVVFTLQLHAQNRGPAPMAGSTPGYNMPDLATVNPASVNQQSPGQSEMEHLAQAQLERDRQVQLKRDTDQLLAMASELKQNVDNTDPRILSIDLIKKTQMIEKLAKSIREKMKGD